MFFKVNFKRIKNKLEIKIIYLQIKYLLFGISKEFSKLNNKQVTQKKELVQRFEDTLHRGYIPKYGKQA